MARRKNVKRIDPRYFLHETALGEQQRFGVTNRPEEDDRSPEALAYWAEQVLQARPPRPGKRVDRSTLPAVFPKELRAEKTGGAWGDEAFTDLWAYQLQRIMKAGGEDPSAYEKLNAAEDQLKDMGFRPSGKETFARPGSPEWDKWGRDKPDYPGPNIWDNRSETGELASGGPARPGRAGLWPSQE